VMDEDGYLWYQGRSDDVFKAAGYRIGPSEIENCLVKHPAVANAAVVPKPDAERGAVVKAYVVLARALWETMRWWSPAAACARRLAPYEYPKEIEFIDATADDHHRQGAAARAAPAGRRARPPLRWLG
jgi:acetyl-CoA synthetase